MIKWEIVGQGSSSYWIIWVEASKVYEMILIRMLQLITLIQVVLRMILRIWSKMSAIKGEWYPKTRWNLKVITPEIWNTEKYTQRKQIINLRPKNFLTGLELAVEMVL